MDIRALADQDHEARGIYGKETFGVFSIPRLVLGEGYCSGFTDSFGKWNTGFYCPNLGNGEPVYCCGISSYKYCCTKRDEEHKPSIDQTALLGIVLGILVAVVLFTLVSCFVCRHFLHFRRRPRAVGGGPLYSMHCSSTASGVANVYSFSAQNSAVTTPIDATEPHVLVNLDCRYPSAVPGQVPVFNATVVDRIPHMDNQPHRNMNMSYQPSVQHEPPPPYGLSNPSAVYNEQQTLQRDSTTNPSISSSQMQPEGSAKSHVLKSIWI